LYEVVGAPIGWASLLCLYLPKGAAMKTLRFVGLGIFFSAGLLFVVSGQEPPVDQSDLKANVRWEYNSVSGENIGKFNELGAEGWELCASTSGTQTRADSFIFKRPKRLNPKPVDEEAHKKVEGTWEHTFADAPEHRQVKIINHTHFVWVTYNREDGKPLLVGGGTDTISGKTYKEKFEFGGPDLPAELVGKEQTFKAEIAEGKWTLSGTLSTGLEIKETWRKVE
jgi:hypothetical protein